MNTLNQNTKIDFSNQKFFIGLDVHKKNWKVTIRCNGMELKTYSMNPSVEELKAHLERNYPGGIYYSVYEAGFCGFWVHRRLIEVGVINIITNPADIPTRAKERSYRTDKIDSRKLARELEKGSLEAIYIPTESQQEQRSLNRQRQQLVKDQVRIKNRIKGLLLFYGKRIPENYEIQNWSGNFIKHLESLEFNTSIGKRCLDNYLTELKQNKSNICELIKSLRETIKQYHQEELLNHLRSIPGVGFISAITLITELMDITRFQTDDQLCSFVGVIPSITASDENVKVLGLNRRHNKYLRNLVIEAAWIAVRKDPAMTEKFNKLSIRMAKQKAIITMSRKLICRIRFVWKNNTPYSINKKK